MSQRVIIDSGPLVALLNAHDTYHEWVVDQLEGCSGTLVTCEAVVSEAVFLLDRAEKRGGTIVVEMLREGALEIAFSLKAEKDSVCALMRKYADVPASLADACLVRMSELLSGHSVLTLDKDFLMYRRMRNQPVPLLIPDKIIARRR